MFVFKKYVKRISACLLAVFVFVCSFSVTAFAAVDSHLDVTVFKDRINTSTGNVVAKGFWAMTCRIPAGRYKVDFEPFPSSYYVVSYSTGLVDGGANDRVEIEVEPGGIIVVTPEMYEFQGSVRKDYCFIVINSYGVEPSIHQIDVVDDTLSAVSSIFGWLSSNLNSVVSVFYNVETGLTLVGYLAAFVTALAVAFTVFCILKVWLHFGK